jgi:CBS domain-containing protein
MTGNAAAPRIPGTVAEFMRREVVSVSPDVTVRELARLLWRHGISGVPVVNAAGRILGLVSATDILWLSDRLAAAAEASPEQGVSAWEGLGTRTVREIMTPDVFAVSPTTSVLELCRYFTRTGVHRVLVVDKHKLVGIVSFFDVVGLIAGERVRAPRPARSPAGTRRSNE